MPKSVQVLGLTSPLRSFKDSSYLLLIVINRYQKNLRVNINHCKLSVYSLNISVISYESKNEYNEYTWNKKNYFCAFSAGNEATANDTFKEIKVKKQFSNPLRKMLHHKIDK